LLIVPGMGTSEFSQEVLPHLPSLRDFARRLGDADDLVQQTYLQAFAARAQFRPGSNARAWLTRILVNVAMTEHRHRSRTRRLEAKLAVEPAVSVENDADRDRAVRQAMSRLSARDREILELSDVEGCRYREMARILEVPLGTVMSRLCRARRRLRAALD
jgi:RNA polymerase sigma-70 factor (ECF subfamily)